MSEKFDFNKLFIFELANNHMGNLKHGIKIIREIAQVTNKFNFKFGFKLQYRDLDTFIHPDFSGRQDIKYVKRFQETRLTGKELKILKDEIRSLGFISICTPFDENSVDLIEAHGFDAIKIGSCSFNDWPLLERVVKCDKPLILSVGGVPVEEMDRVVAFLQHRNKLFCLMHCVGEYPSSKDRLQLNQIDFLRLRYPNIPIGYSTHEEPDNFDAIKLAVAKRASVFERHVGIETGAYKMNKYSSTPLQVEKWLSSAKEAFAMCGFPDNARHISEEESRDLRGLKRGVFARKKILKGERIDSSEVFLAIPNVGNQVLANDLSKYTEFFAKKTIQKNEPLKFCDVKAINLRGRVLQIINKLRDVVIESKVSLPDRIDFELSHHYGIDKFERFGAAIINCINREYCKKLIIMLPGQSHPYHYHNKKEETFNFLYGDIRLVLDGKEKECKPGEMVVVERGMKHSFKSRGGAIFEEISTTHFVGDSYYDDKRILKNKDRKTEMTFWSDWLAKPVS